MIDLFSALITTLAAALISGVLCALVAAVVPQRLRRARDTISTVPASAALVGFLSMVGVAAVSIFYIVSLLLIIPLLLLPVALIGWLAFGALLLFGLVVIAEPFGHFLLRRRDVYAAPMVAAAIGGFGLMLGLQILSWLPFIGWLSDLLGVLVTAMGLGALLLTRLGARPYPETVTAGTAPISRLV